MRSAGCVIGTMHPRVTSGRPTGVNVTMPRASRSANCCLVSLKAADCLFMANPMEWLGGNVKVLSSVAPERLGVDQ
jgi:hypothetical protein